MNFSDLICRTRFAKTTGLAICCASVVITLATSNLAAQQSTSAADFFPGTTAVFVHVEKPAELIGTIETHPVVNFVLEMKEVKQLMRSPQFAMAMLGRGLLETQIEENVIQALKTNTANGLWLGVDTATNGVVIMFQSKDEDRLKLVAGQVLKLVTTTAANSGNKSPFKKQEYRDAVAAEFDGFLVARYESWFLLTNKPKFAKQIVDNMIDGSDATLSQQDWFKKALAQRQPSDVWAAIDLETIRQSSAGKEPFIGRTDNPGVELIFGGILDALKNAPVVLAEFNIKDNIDLTLSTPFDAKWANEAREFFFGEELGGFAPGRWLQKI